MSLNIELADLETAITDAYRFLGAAQAQVQAIRNNKKFTSKQNAKTWRASLDLAESMIYMRRRNKK